MHFTTIAAAIVLTALTGPAASRAWAQATKSNALGTVTIEGITNNGPLDMLSVQWEVTNQGSGATFGLLKVTKAVDATSPLLILATASGSIQPRATVILAPQGKDGAGATFVLEDVVIRSLQTSINAQGAVVEEVGLAFGKIQTTVGGVTAGWNIELNKGV
jgi:type VI protein secretion system component Hcp